MMALLMAPRPLLRQALARVALMLALPMAQAAPSASVDELRLQPFANAPVWKDQDLVAPVAIVDDRGRKVQPGATTAAHRESSAVAHREHLRAGTV